MTRELSRADGICGQFGTERKSGEEPKEQWIKKIQIFTGSGRNTVTEPVYDVQTPDEVSQYHKGEQGRQ